MVSSQPLLPNVTGSPTQNPTLEVGDMACVDDGSGPITMYICEDATLGAASWVAVGASGTALPTTRSYGSTTLVFGKGLQAIPASSASLLDVADRSGGHVELISRFNSDYRNCLVRIRIADNSGILSETTTRFASLAALVTWVNANVPNNGSAFTAYAYMEVYDQIDGSTPGPPKVYGKNRFWAGLTNRAPARKYDSPGTGSCFYANLAGTTATAVRSTLLNQMWQLLFPANPMPAPNTWTANEFGCFYISRNRYRRYDMPAFSGSALLVTPRPDRFVRQGGATLPFSSGSLIYDPLAGDQVVYASLNSAGTSGTTFGSFEAFSQLQDRLFRGESIIAAYPLQTNGQRAVLIKPVGQDQWYFDTFDPATFQLEAVATNREGFRNKLRVLNPTQAFENRSSGPLDVTAFMNAMGASLRQRTGGIPGRHGYYTGRVRFQYRNLITNQVTALTEAMIEPVVRRRARPFCFMTRNRPR